MEKRHLKVCDPEKQNGNVEYKRQLIKPSVSRLRSLATQMSYRLDEGHGECIYHIGVEDDGCHSLLDYPSISHSSMVLECIARSLNVIITKKVMIQGEIEEVDGEPKLCDSSLHSNIQRIEETPIFSFKSLGDVVKSLDNNDNASKLRKQPGVYTRCIVTAKRIETHRLDSSPIPLFELTNGHIKLADIMNDSNGANDKLNNDSSNQKDGTSSSKDHEKKEKKSDEGKDANGGKDNHTNKGNDQYSEEKEEDVISNTLSERNIRVAVVGNVDAGKSTLIGTLTTSSLDDGRGRSRTTIMKHRHEIESGRTSTATSHLMGFRHCGEPIMGKDTIRANKRKSEDEVVRESYRIVTLLDLAGHEKYLKTTIHGVSSGFSDYSMILVNSRHPPTHMTQHHLNLCCSFGIPTIIVFTKIDGCPEHALKTSKEEVFKLLRAPDVARKPFAIRKEEDIVTCSGNLHVLAPVLEISCVTGGGLDLLRKLLFSLPKRRRHEKKKDRSFEFLVEEIFNVPGVGPVVSGFVNAGELVVGSNAHVFLGPMDDGNFIKTVAKSAHISRINTTSITAGQSACLALALKKEDKHKLRRGMVVLSESPSCTREFDAEICVLKGEGTTIRKSYQAYVHILNVRQTAFAKNIELVNSVSLPPSHKLNREDDVIVLRPGSRAKVRFEFSQRPEYVRPGMRMLFRDGRVRGVGLVTDVHQMTP
jgi:small GTP-binding protein